VEVLVFASTKGKEVYVKIVEVLRFASTKREKDIAILAYALNSA
jgi:hypothetical protein